MGKTEKWTPAVPIRKYDNIMSSGARERGESGFIPSFEKVSQKIWPQFWVEWRGIFLQDKVDNMKYIMSFEYLRIWIKERDAYNREIYSKMETDSDSKGIKRRFVQRYTKRRDTGLVLPPITSKMLVKWYKNKQGGALMSKTFKNLSPKCDELE